MSLKGMLDREVPEDTARIARKARPKDHPYLLLRDQLGLLFEEVAFAPLFAPSGRPAQSPWRLALVSILQLIAGLTDRQAADQVRSRLDWKYLLGLSLEAEGFDYTLLCDFRTRLIAGAAEMALFEWLLQRCQQRDLLRRRGRQRTDATHVLAAVRSLTRTEGVCTTWQPALNVLAQAAPDWLVAQADPAWGERYSTPLDLYRLPKESTPRQAWVLTLGEDGWTLLQRVHSPNAPAHLADLPAIGALRWIWLQQFYWHEQQLKWRDEDNSPPCALRICSPFDLEARYSRKRETTWTGYKQPLTETCDADRPRLIVAVHPTPATPADSETLPVIQADLKARDLLARQHLVDSAYLSAETILACQDEQVELLGPAPEARSWQTQVPQRLDASHFEIDWAAHPVHCPAGKVSRHWQVQTQARGSERSHVRFAASECRECGLHSLCTQAKTGARVLLLLPQAAFGALSQARTRQKQPDFALLYAARAGCESTMAQYVRTPQGRRSRYVGQAKTHLQALFSSIGLNLLRLCAWWSEHRPEKRFPSSFANLKSTLPSASPA